LRLRLRRLSRLSVTGLLAASAVALAGCGGGSPTSTTPTTTQRTHTVVLPQLTAKEYRARLDRISKEVEQSTSVVTNAMKNARTLPELSAVLENYISDQKTIAGEVERLAAPQDARAANALLVRGLRDSANQLQILVPSLSGAPSVQAALTFIQKNAPAGGKEIDSAVNELKKLGYTKGS
jgi:hypothetical protein